MDEKRADPFITTEENHVGFWHRAKVMLGLADDYDEEYENDDQHEYDDDDYHHPATEAPRPSYDKVYGDSASVRRVNREPDVPRAREASRDWERGSREGAPPRSVSPAWGEQEQAPGPQVKMHITEPLSYSEAQGIADKLKAGTPVIMNLTSTDPDLSKRLIDFASGLTYGIGGGLQKVSDRVFMLTPANVSVSAEDRRRLRDKGLFNLDV